MAEQANIRAFIAPLKGSGRLAPTLLEDLTLYDPYKKHVNGSLLELPPINLGNVQFLHQNLPPNSCQHAFYVQPRQTTRPALDERPSPSSKYRVTAFCRLCRVHVVLTVDYSRRGKEAPCPDQDRPLHHLILSPYHTDRTREELRRQESRDRSEIYVYECSASECSAVVTVRLSPAELKQNHIDQLLDPDLLRARTDDAFEVHRANTEGMKRPTPVDVLVDLKAYISNAWNPESRPDISLDNKRFAVRFGPQGDACHDLLSHLCFERKETSWQVPQPDRDESGDLAQTRRNAFLDNIEHELNALVMSRPVEERQASHDQTRLEDASREFARVLGCQDYDRTPMARSMSLHPSQRPPAFIVLGIPQDASDSLVEFAYDRQIETDPNFITTYMYALRDISGERGTEALQVKVAIEESRGRVDWNQMTAAYAALGLPANVETDEDHIIGTFNSRLQDSPSQEAELREHLRVIGEGTQSKKIKDYAAKEIKTYQQALDFLNAQDSMEDSWIQSLYTAKVYENPSLQDLAAKSVNVIAQHRKSESLQAFVTSGFTTEASLDMDIDEAYKTLEIQDRTVEDDLVLTVYHMRRSDDGANSERFVRALTAIAQSRQSPLLLHELQMGVPVAPKLNEPVGLENIGNTCYLNSLLQFLFTVKELRDILLRFDQYKMSPTTELLEVKRVGQRKISALEVENGQKFAGRLADLFYAMITTSRTAIRPEQELARLTLETDQVKEKIRRRSTLGGAARPTLGSIDNRPVHGPLPAGSGERLGLVHPPPLTIPRDSEALADDDSTRAMGSSPADLESDALMVGDDDNSSEATLVSRPDSDDGMDMHVSAAQQQYILDNKENLAPVKTSVHKDDFPNDMEPLRPASPSKVNTQAGSLTGKHGVEMAELEAPPIQYRPPPGPPPVPPRKPIQSSAAQLEEYAQQQDVTEVINHCLFQLSTAMRPKGFDESGEQQDEVHDLFFGGSRTHTIPETELRTSVPFLNINAHVDNQPKDVYAALDNYFDLTEADTGQKSFVSITRLPPVLTVALSRVVWDAEAKTQKKLQHHVEMPQQIFLDRYLESNTDSFLMQRRQQSWELKQQLVKLDEKAKFYEQAHAGSKDVASLFDDAKTALKFLSTQVDQDAQFGGSIDIDPALPALLGSYAKTVRKQVEQLNIKRTEVRRQLATTFADMQQHPYVLHAAFFHRGTHGSGHYWVYIKDQKTGIWRKYNDDFVTIVEDTRDIFDVPTPAAVNAAVPTAYVLVYIKAGTETEPLDHLVETVRREPVQNEPEIPMTELAPLGNDDWVKPPNQMVEVRPEKVRFDLDAGPGGQNTSASSEPYVEHVEHQNSWGHSEPDIDPQSWYR